MTIKKKINLNIILSLLLIGLLFELVRSSFRSGDFIGYINAGNLVLASKDIYSDYLNTWPPFFAVFCVPLSIMDSWNANILRFVWLAGSLLAMFYVIRITVYYLLEKEVQWPFLQIDSSQIAFTNTLVFIPFVIVYRFILDNMANVQINIYMLWMAVLVFHLFLNKRVILAAAILAFSVSLKVYTLFIFCYFIYKRAFKITAFTFLFLMIFNTIPFLIFGTEQAMAYYGHWYHEIASSFASIQHKNQSLFSMFRSWFTYDSPGLSIYVNFLDLNIETVKQLAYGLLIVGALLPAWFFRQKIKIGKNKILLLEYVFILTAIPILSPIAWKAYFIFLWGAYLITYYYLFHTAVIKKQWNLILKSIFFISVILNVFSTEGIIGGYYSDLMEVYSCITIGTLLCLIMILVIYLKIPEEELAQQI